MLLEGSVKLTKVAANGREVVLGLRDAGDVVGELGALDGRPRSANAVALGPVTSLSIGADRFNELLRTRAGIGHRLTIAVVRRLREASDRQVELGTVDVVGRVCARLAELVVGRGTIDGERAVIEAGMSQQELAEWCGVSRDGVVRALTELRRRGLVETGRKRIVVNDLAAVRNRARGAAAE